MSFGIDLQPGGEFEAPGVAISIEPGPDRSPGRRSALSEVGRRYWFPDRPQKGSVPTEWNHWFPYTDTEISQASFAALNVDAGRPNSGSKCARSTPAGSWPSPSSRATGRTGGGTGTSSTGPVSRTAWGCSATIAAVGAWVSAFGARSKAWAGAPALGGKRDQLEARRGGEPAGYVCFGCPQTREWAAGVIGDLVAATGCTWVKLDFNVDPGLGCYWPDHGHGAGSGLYEHVRGYYEFLDDLRGSAPRGPARATARAAACGSTWPCFPTCTSRT